MFSSDLGVAEALIVLLVSLSLFVMIGIRKNNYSSGNDSFFYSNHNESARDVAFSWSASSLSLGLTTLYYLQMTAIFGWKIFFISILTYFCGQLVFRRVALRWLKSNQSTGSGTSAAPSVLSVLSTANAHISVQKIAQFSGLLSLTAMLYAELYFGSMIVAALVGVDEQSIWTTGFFVVCFAVAALYVLIGGMEAIINSDRWQLFMFWLALASLAIVCIIIFLSGYSPVWSSSVDWYVPGWEKSDGLSLLMFGFAANILPLLCQNNLWQISGTTTRAQFRTSSWNGIKGTFLTFGVVILIGFTLRGVAGDSGEVSINLIFDTTRALGDVGIYLLLPIIFVGLVAAMISTIDNLILAITMSVIDLSPKSVRAGDEKSFRLLVVLGLFLFLTIVVVIVKHVAESEFQLYFVPLVFFLFSQAAPFGVVVGLAAIRPGLLRKGPMVSLGLILAWLTDFAGFIAAIVIGLGKLQLFATPLAILIAILFAVRFDLALQELISKGGAKSGAAGVRGGER